MLLMVKQRYIRYAPRLQSNCQVHPHCQQGTKYAIMGSSLALRVACWKDFTEYKSRRPMGRERSFDARNQNRDRNDEGKYAALVVEQNAQRVTGCVCGLLLLNGRQAASSSRPPQGSPLSINFHACPSFVFFFCFHNGETHAEPMPKPITRTSWYAKS